MAVIDHRRGVVYANARSQSCVITVQQSVLTTSDRRGRTVEIVGTGKRRIIGLSVFGILVLFSLLRFIAVPEKSTSIAQAKEWALQEDLSSMRSLIRQYTAELHKRPESLQDLIAAGYLKQLPKDPLTDQRDSWTVEWSSNPTSPGVVNVRSGASGTSSRGIRYSAW